MDVGFETKNAGGKSGTNEWYTPSYIIEALGGKFDLDPCAPKNEWHTAKTCYTEEDNGLILPWEGEVFLNPPYSRPEVDLFMRRMAEHANGIALLYARVGNDIFFNHVWNHATSVVFLRKRIHFLDTEMRESGAPGADSALIAYGYRSDVRLRNLKLEGKYIRL